MINTTFPPHKIPPQIIRHRYWSSTLFLFVEAMEYSPSADINMQVIVFQHMITEEELEDRGLRFEATHGEGGEFCR